MKVALFGGTGFVGSYIIDNLILEGHDPIVLVREGSESKVVQSSECSIIQGSIEDLNVVNRVLENADAVIYNIGLIREFPRKGITWKNLHFEAAKFCIDLTIKNNIKRFILMSANGVKPTGPGYQKYKWMAEQYLKNTDLDWTIFRPSLLFGDPRGDTRPEFCSQLKRDMISLPVPAPLFHEGILPLKAGNFSMSPIHVSNVASIFSRALTMKKTHNKIYTLGGTKDIIWKDIINIIANSYGKNKWTIPAPAIAIKTLASLFDSFSWFPVTKDQLSMLMEGNTCTTDNIFVDDNHKLIDFEPNQLAYLK